jgi:hypothetical protein
LGGAETAAAGLADLSGGATAGGAATAAAAAGLPDFGGAETVAAGAPAGLGASFLTADLVGLPRRGEINFTLRTAKQNIKR